MKLKKQNAELYIPKIVPTKHTLSKTTHMAIAAHHDDVEIMAYDGILKCYKKDDLWFAAVIVTDGSGCVRAGKYRDYSNQEMMQTRKKEQKKAAEIGGYNALALLDYPSSAVSTNSVVEELAKLILETKPQVLYTHNLADKHQTHIGVVVSVIKAIRTLDVKSRPKCLYGCEVWRDLDWMLDSEKMTFDVSGNKELALDLIKVFDSQIASGKQYDLATLGRRLANATYAAPRAIDKSDAVTYAMDLTPLIKDDELDVLTYVTKYIERFKEDVKDKIKKVLKK